MDEFNATFLKDSLAYAELVEPLRKLGDPGTPRLVIPAPYPFMVDVMVL